MPPLCTYIGGYASVRADWPSPDGPQRKDSYTLFESFLTGAAMMVAAANPEQAQTPFSAAQEEVVSTRAEQSAEMLPDCWRVGIAK